MVARGRPQVHCGCVLPHLPEKRAVARQGVQDESPTIRTRIYQARGQRRVRLTQGLLLERAYLRRCKPSRAARVLSLSLKRSDSLVQYIEAESATIMTSNARIEGKFNVSRSLDLQTTNQPIEAEVTLSYDALTQGDASTNLTLHTANA